MVKHSEESSNQVLSGMNRERPIPTPRLTRRSYKYPRKSEPLKKRERERKRTREGEMKRGREIEREKQLMLNFSLTILDARNK